MNSLLKLASIQLNSQDDIDANLAIIQTAIATASQHGAKLAVLPENACLMGYQQPLAKRFDEICDWYSTLAYKYNIHLVAGTLPCPIRFDGSMIDHDKFCQTSLIFDNTGKQIARYDKIHLFRAEVADGVGSYDEGRTFEAGNQTVVAQCTIDGIPINIGMMICFDGRFALMAHKLRRLGADILTLPSAFTHVTGQAHWQLLLQARALDSQCLVIGATQGGTHHFNHKDKVLTRQTWGHAMIVNAHGQVVASTGQTQVGKSGFEVVYANFDKNAQQRIRQTMPIMDCHRPYEFYG